MEVAGNRIDRVKALVNSNFGLLNRPDRMGRTPLMLAIYYGYETLTDWLLTETPDLTLEDNRGHSALAYAAIAGKPGLVKKGYFLKNTDEKHLIACNSDPTI